MFNKVLEMLKIETLDEKDQEELKSYLEEAIDLKAREKVEEEKDQIRKDLVEEYEEKFEEYVDSYTSKFSDFVDSVLEEELELPEKIQHYAKLGEDYEEVIENFKAKLSINEGMIEEEVKSLLREAKEEIETLKSDLDEKIEKELELTSDARQFAAQLYVLEKCEGMTELQRKKVTALLEGVYSQKEIDRKFEFITEHLGIDEKKSKNEEDDEDEKECVCPECGKTQSISEGSCSAVKCPECDEKMTDKKDENKGKGKGEVDEDVKDDDKKINEDVNDEDDSFNKYMNEYVSVFKNGKW